jgi:hypothetical protein
MKKFSLLSVFCLGLLLSATASAAQSVKLDMNLDMNGKKSTPSIIVNFDKEATLTSKDDSGNGYEIVVLSKQFKNKDKNAKKAVEMSFKIFELVDNKSTLVASPRVTSLIGEEATLETQSKDGKMMSLSIVPTIL